MIVVQASEPLTRRGIARYCAVLTIDEYSARWPRLEREFRSAGVEPIRMIGFHSSAYRSSRRPDGALLTAQAQAVLDGMKRLLEHVGTLDWPYAAVFEDDVVFSDAFEGIDRALAAVPEDWDVVYLGGNWNLHPYDMVNEHVYRLGFTLNTHAFIVHRRFIATLLAVIAESTGSFEVDVSFARAHSAKLGNWYGLLPDMVWQCGLTGGPVSMDPLQPGQLENFQRLRDEGRIGDRFIWRNRQRTTLDDYEAQIERASKQRRRFGARLRDRPLGVPGRFAGNGASYEFTDENGQRTIRMSATMAMLLAACNGENSISSILDMFRNGYRESAPNPLELVQGLEELASLGLINNDLAPAARDKYLVIGMRRSGTHAIAHWLMSNMTGGNEVSLPGPMDSMLSADGRIRFFNDVDRLFDSFGDHTLFGCEDKSYAEIDLDAREADCNILILRDPYNMLASRLRRPTFDHKLRTEEIVRKWIEHAREYLRETDNIPNKVPVSYNRWLSCREYRDEVSARLGWFNHDVVDFVPHNGGGSSFVGRKLDRLENYNARHLSIQWPSSVLEILADSEAPRLAREIFPSIDAGAIGL